MAGRPAFTLVLFLLLLAMACQESTAGTLTAPLSPTATASSSSAENTSLLPTPTPGQPKRGGVFRRLWMEPPTLDPHLTQDVDSSVVVLEVFSGLVTLSPDLEIIPDIAKSWEITNGGITYTFHLRDDVKFHDGKRVTAHDFQYSFERAADPETLSPIADTYLGDIVGAKEKLQGRTNAISGVRVLDDLTLELTVDAPKVYILAKLTYPTAFVVDRGNIEKLGRRWTEKPNGTGPFKLKEYSVGEVIVLERNEDFYRGPPYLDEVEFILRGGSTIAMYENGEIDLAGVGLATLARLEDPSNPLHQELITAPLQFDLAYIGFNVTKPPFDDPKVRQALTYAIDKELIASEVLEDLSVPAWGILPLGFPGHTLDIQGLRYDLEKAKALLRESRYDPAAGNFPDLVVMTVPGTGGALGLDLQIITEVWRQDLGIDVEFRQVEWATFLQDLNRQELQLFAGIGWQADYPDPGNFLDVLFHSESEINDRGYSNSQVDRLLEEARVEQDPQRRIQLYQEVERLVVEEATLIPLWFTGERKALVKPYVQGYRFTPLNVPKLQYVWIDKG